MKRLIIALLALVTGAMASAETITGTFTFQDGNGKPAPIRNSKVEIHRKRPNHLHWEVAATVHTDAEGHINAAVEPFMGNGTAFTLRVYATNRAVVVYTKDNFLAHYYSQPGPPGKGIQHTSSGPNNTHDFSWNFTEDFANGHFNAADAMLRGLEYAEARRDPREVQTEPIATVAVQMTSQDVSYYDPLIKVVRLNWSAAMSDFSALHEYAHYLEERISGFTPIAANHIGCSATVGAVHVESPGHAWMEGFANYFSQAVRVAFGSVVNGPVTGTIPVLETPSCPGSTVPRMALEEFVTAALLDLLDTNGNEPFDRFCAGGYEIDRIIFQIFDRELDIGGNPSLQHFIDAWIARGLDLPPLAATFGGSGGSGIAVASPRTVMHFDAAPAANLAVWRPGTAQWWVIGGASGTTPVWGEPSDIPVPADYDGDSLTDIAIWRPRDGNWWVLLSGSGNVQITQWGTNDDVPLPADYDGDREVDFAVYRPSDETLYIYSDACGPHRTRRLGKGVPVVGKFTSDPADQPGIFDSAGGFVMHQRLATGSWATFALNVALPPDPSPPPVGRASVGRVIGGLQPAPKLIAYEAPRPVIGDYDGDGRSDAAIYVPATGMWSVQGSKAGPMTRQWGVAGDIPVPADYDADGRTDFGVWRPSTGEWWVLYANGQQRTTQWGTNGDVPVPAR